MTTEVNSYDEVTDIKRFNDLLDAMTLKPYVSPVLFVQGLRAACDLHGITMPLTDMEGSDGPTVQDSMGILYRANSPHKPQFYAPPTEGEYAYNIMDGNGELTDLFLYFVVNKDEETGFYDCYAQIVDDDDLQDLLDFEMPELKAPIQDDNYLRQVRHASSSHVVDLDDAPPQD